jgi:hypothetical protein
VVQVVGDITIEDMDMFYKYLVLVLHKGGILVICPLPTPRQIDLNDGMHLEDLTLWFLPMLSNMCTTVPRSNHDFKPSIFHAVISKRFNSKSINDIQNITTNTCC